MGQTAEGVSGWAWLLASLAASRALPRNRSSGSRWACSPRDGLPPGTPRIYFHPRPFEIIQTPGRVLISYEYQQLLRAVYTDGRPHRSDLAASWMGDSTGHWEGETLVVESVNFNENTWIDRRGVPHSDQLRVDERLSLNDNGQLIVDVLVEDPVAFIEPWTGRKVFDRVDWTIEEFVCLDNLSFQDFEQILLDHDE